MMIRNIVKEVLSYKKGQIQQKLSSPQSFVSSRFHETLQSTPVKEVKATAAYKSRRNEPIDSTT